MDFFDQGNTRLNKVMFVGNLHEGKGIPQIIKYAKDNPSVIFDFYYKRACAGLKSQLKTLNNCNLVGYVPKEQIFENYNKYKYFIHIPNHQESFGRAVGEAFLSGCNLITNDRVGALSYGWDYREFRENTLYSNYLFWEKLEKTL
jgi:glycosyltransferase involved in cell wall biosynthesis